MLSGESGTRGADVRQRGLVSRRSRAESAVLSAAAVTVLVTTTLLTALVAYSTAVTRAGVAAVVEASPARQVAVEVSAPPADDEAAAAAFDERVASAAADAFAGLDPEVSRSTLSASFAVPPDLADLAPGPGGRPPLTVLVGYDDLAGHADLVSGAWADDPVDGEPLPVTVHDEAATVLGLEPGDGLTLATRAEDESVEVLVTGTYRPRDTGDPAFFDDVLETTGRDDGSFLALGPFAATPSGYEQRVPGRSVARWRIAPDPVLLDLDGIARAVDGAERVEAAVENDTVSITGQSARILVDTSLQSLDDAIAEPVQVARSTVLVPVLLLSLLGAVALVLTVLLLSERRRSETATLRARGATRAQVGRWAAAEALVLVVPAAVLGPPAAAGVLQVVDSVGPLAGAGLDLSTTPESGWWLTAALVALACGALLVAVAVATATGSVRAAHPSRPSRRIVVSRAGIDLALLGLAAVAWFQLRQYGIAGTAGLAGTGTDPLVVAAPAVVVLAVAVVALRALPPVTAFLQAALRRRGPVGASLALWHVGRRPARYAGPALLLVMATAVGTLSLAYTATWTTAQRDLATQQAGADVRVTANAVSLRSLPASERVALYRDVPDVREVMRVARVDTRGTEPSTLLAVEAEQAQAVMVTRKDLTGDAGGLVAPLVAGRPARPAVPLPDDATTLQLTATLDAIGDPLPTLPPVLSVLLADDTGSLVRASLGELQPNGEATELSVRLGDVRESAVGGLAMVAVDLQVSSFLGDYVNLELTVADLATTDASVPQRLQSGAGWVAAATGGAGVDRPPRAGAVAGGPSGFTGQVTTGTAQRLGATSAVFRFAFADGPMPRESLQQVTGSAPPAVVTRALAGRDDVEVGDEVVVEAPGGPLVIRVAAVVERLPTVPADTAAVLVDLATLATLELLREDDPVRADEWWLATTPGSSGHVAADVRTVAGAPDDVVDLEALAQQGLQAPLGIGLAGALGVGALAALVITTIGFAVHAAASARERLTEFALLRAMGFSRRQLLGVLATEQGVLAVVGVLIGLVVGALASALLVPQLVDPSLADAAPSLRVTVDPVSLTLFVVVVLTLLAAVAGGVAGSLRGRGLGSALRLGEDR